MIVITAIQQGDELIFRQVFDEYHKKLHSYILSKTKSTYLADEVVQLTFIKLWNYRSALNENFTISTHLFRIASTTLIDLLRKQNSFSTLVKELGIANKIIDDNNSSGKLDEKEVKERLAKAIDTLPAIRQRVFELSRVKGLTNAEIAELLSISKKTVENHISMAIKQIRRFFPVASIVVAMLALFFQFTLGVISFQNVYIIMLLTDK